MSEREIMETVAQSKGLVAIDGDRGTFFAVKRLKKAGKLEFCGRDHDGCGNRWILVQAKA